MILLSLAWKSLKNRKLTTSLTLFSIALSVGLLIGVEHVRRGVREHFSHTISQTDLIVGARGGTLQLLLYAVFGMGTATNNISYATYDKLRQHPAVKWTIPYSLGDSHRGFRVIGTTEDFYKEYRYRQDRQLVFAAGKPASEVFDVVLGHTVAQQLGYTLGDAIVVAHGVTSGRGIIQHDDKPFRVVGILRQTATPVDRALYITLEGMEAMHIDWQAGAPPRPGEAISAAQIRKETIQVQQITAFLLRTKSRMETLRLQREINTFADEPLMTIIPGVALSELWRTVGYAEDALKVVTIFVMVVGLLGMLMALYTSLHERRREMAILRAVGVGPWKILSLLILESGLLSMLGSLGGVVLVYSLLLIFQPIIEKAFGLYLPLMTLSGVEYVYLALTILGGCAIGLIPALKAYRNTLADGLSMRL
ncbi:MAG: FtsX-like permease family protein [Candidatus Tectomicrobia bacterium]|uniref:FtsX-like permease family protein n=1 Tax=Tectimicrobiota bacterium TaxID=2528274 RepID=A0A937VWH5_UNCTE|nr:FtsX-like permease family protein [Candidatus Tectomicrobia bacterium]